MKMGGYFIEYKKVFDDGADLDGKQVTFTRLLFQTQ